MNELQDTDVRGLAALINLEATLGDVVPDIQKRIPEIKTFLEKHEAKLGIRTAWLTWMSMYKLCGNDVLLLAKARDRLLERLLTYGLSLERDVPSFVRFGQKSGNNPKFRNVVDRISQLSDLSSEWIKKSYANSPAVSSQEQTQAYKDLLFSFGLARLGETDKSKALHSKAKTTLLKKEDGIHQFLYGAFEYRINQAIKGEPHSGSLPAKLFTDLQAGLLKITNPDKVQQDAARKAEAYKADKMREHLKTLEPHERMDAYRTWRTCPDELSQKLAKLNDLTGPALEKEIESLTADNHKKPEAIVRVLMKAFELGDRLTETYISVLLTRLLGLSTTIKTVKEQYELAEKASLLERALFFAAHWNKLTEFQSLIKLFMDLLESRKGGMADEAVSLAAECFRGLRKMGLREEIDGLLNRVYGWITGGKDIKTTKKETTDWYMALRMLLQLASGWFFFGKNELAMPIMEEARSVLYNDDKVPQKDRVAIAKTYAAALGQAPVDVALTSLAELFKKFPALNDTYTTNSHYSRSQLEVIEAVVLAVASEDFSTGGGLRRWLDEDEYLVRKRIHRDFDNANKAAQK